MQFTKVTSNETVVSECFISKTAEEISMLHVLRMQQEMSKDGRK